jgi:uncharacterized protein (UPF0248 family)
LGVLKAALNLAFREGHASSDEAWRWGKSFREANAPKIRYLDHTEAQRLVNACEPAFRPLVQCALLTECRYGEIVGLRVGDFERDAGIVSVRASKAGRPRHVVLTEDGITLFERHTAGKDGTAPAELTPAGQTVWEWRSWEHLDPVADGIAEVQALRTLWAMGNSVLELPNGDILVSYRPTSTVIRIDRKTGNIIWKLGPPTLAGQHAPTPLENGNVLIFDNGVHRLDDPLPFSRVIEINPATNEIVWTYQDRPVSTFFSPRMGNAQRLPNGNTLINEASFGRVFEVTRDGEIVWEYVNPFFGGPPHAETNEVFRALRYSAEEIARAEATARA